MSVGNHGGKNSGSDITSCTYTGCVVQTIGVCSKFDWQFYLSFLPTFSSCWIDANELTAYGFIAPLIGCTLVSKLCNKHTTGMYSYATYQYTIQYIYIYM